MFNLINPLRNLGYENKHFFQVDPGYCGEALSLRCNPMIDKYIIALNPGIYWERNEKNPEKLK